MSIELQMKSSAYADLVRRSVQEQLRWLCADPIGPVYVDHADVAPAPVEVFASGPSVRARVPVDAFFVLRDQVLAHPNATPPEATTQSLRVGFVLELATRGTALTVQCVDAELPVLGPGFGFDPAAAKASLLKTVTSTAAGDVTIALRDLGLPRPTTSRVELVGSAVAVRFDPDEPAADRLAPDQAWGFYIDGATMTKVAQQKVETSLRGELSSLRITSTWRPSGPTPVVHIEFSGKSDESPAPLAGDVSGTFDCAFAMAAPPYQGLRTTIGWSLAVDTGPLSPALVDKLARAKAVEGFNKAIAKMGGTPVSERSFYLEQGLPKVELGTARLWFDSAVASASGMTLGGSVRLAPEPSTELVTATPTEFSMPYRIELCSELAKTGSGVAERDVGPSGVKTRGGIGLADAGKYCGVEIVSAKDPVSTYLTPPPRTEAEDLEVVIEMPSSVAQRVTEPVRMIVRTARGVRSIVLQAPPPVQVNEQGKVTNAYSLYVPDCPDIAVGPTLEFRGAELAAAIRQEMDAALGIGIDNPEGWAAYLLQHRGINVKLVSLLDLDAGELIQMRSPDHAIDVVADARGIATVPVILPIVGAGRATVTRINRRPIAGHFRVETATVRLEGALETSHMGRVRALPGGEAVVMLGSDGRGDAFQLRASQAPERLTVSQEEAPPARQSPLSEGVDLPGVETLFSIPGFADRDLAVARLADGSQVLVTENGDGTRVAGSFAGPIGEVDVDGDWAVAPSAEGMSLFQVTRT